MEYLGDEVNPKKLGLGSRVSGLRFHTPSTALAPYSGNMDLKPF